MYSFLDGAEKIRHRNLSIKDPADSAIMPITNCRNCYVYHVTSVSSILHAMELNEKDDIKDHVPHGKLH